MIVVVLSEYNAYIYLRILFCPVIKLVLSDIAPAKRLYMYHMYYSMHQKRGNSNWMANIIYGMPL